MFRLSSCLRLRTAPVEQSIRWLLLLCRYMESNVYCILLYCIISQGCYYPQYPLITPRFQWVTHWLVGDVVQRADCVYCRLNKCKTENKSSNHSLCWVYGSQPSSSKNSQCGFSKLSLKLSMILWDHKIRKSGLNSESEAPRHAYMSTLSANSEFETSMIKKLQQQHHW